MFTCARASFISLQLGTLQALSSSSWRFVLPLEWAYPSNRSHWFSSLAHLYMDTPQLQLMANAQPAQTQNLLSFTYWNLNLRAIPIPGGPENVLIPTPCCNSQLVLILSQQYFNLLAVHICTVMRISATYKDIFFLPPPLFTIHVYPFTSNRQDFRANQQYTSAWSATYFMFLFFVC